MALGLLMGCQSYQPRPLEPDAHRSAWHARTLEDASLKRFLERTRDSGHESAAAFDVADGLSLEEGRLVALFFHPRLRLARLGLELAAADAANSGVPTDPQLQATILRTRENIPDRWIVSPGLSFSIPLSGRLSAARRLADAELESEWRTVQQEEWEVRGELQAAWVEWSASLLRLEEAQGFAQSLGGLTAITRALAESGELSRTEARLLALEEAQLGTRITELRGAADRAEQRLRSVLGLAPDAPVDFVPTLAGVDPSAEFDLDTLFERNAELARLRADYEVAERAVAHQLSRRMPDLQLGPQVESEEGQTRLGVFGTASLPFFNGNRRAIARARGLRELARAAYETEYERLAGRWAVTEARANTLAEVRADIETNLVPLVDQQVREALQMLELGESTTVLLLESLRKSREIKLALIDARVGEALARSELEHLAGPPERTSLAMEPTESDS